MTRSDRIDETCFVLHIMFSSGFLLGLCSLSGYLGLSQLPHTRVLLPHIFLVRQKDFCPRDYYQLKFHRLTSVIKRFQAPTLLTSMTRVKVVSFNVIQFNILFILSLFPMHFMLVHIMYYAFKTVNNECYNNGHIVTDSALVRLYEHIMTHNKNDIQI